MSLLYTQAKFLLSVAKLEQLPPDEGAEVAFVGRSNAGKSSALNALTKNKNLARTSKTPGRTQMINYFALDDEHRLVDLPGYGYAKVSRTLKDDWQLLLQEYLETRLSLAGLVLLMDIRHPFMPVDSQMIDWATHSQVPIHILLTKSDKLSRSDAMNTLFKVKKSLEYYGDLTSVQLFSATRSVGLEELVAALDQWLIPNEASE
ncbi:MAG: YihA family ribosome biogenesis GTP-binding protein [Proteobacteria bacterium]|nr:YihA family ribosome biogenesis GTP-binding protein [Pseudomonadota bacterium]